MSGVSSTREVLAAFAPADLVFAGLADAFPRPALSAAADPLDRGRRYRELMGQNNWSLRRLARELRLTPATVSAALRIAEAGPEILQRLRAGQITQSEALAAVRTADPKTLTAGSILGRSKKNQRGTRQSYSTADGTRIQVLHRRRIGAAEIRRALLGVAALLEEKKEGPMLRSQCSNLDVEP